MTLTQEEKMAVLRHAKSLLIEHCSEVVIIAKFIPEDPSCCAPVLMTTYTSPSEALGLLSWGTEKTKHDLWQEFRGGHHDEEPPPGQVPA